MMVKIACNQLLEPRHKVSVCHTETLNQVFTGQAAAIRYMVVDSHCFGTRPV